VDNGKSAAVAQAVDITVTAEIFQYYAGWATKIEGRSISISAPFAPGTTWHAYTTREPAGVVLLKVCAPRPTTRRTVSPQVSGRAISPRRIEPPAKSKPEPCGSMPTTLSMLRCPSGVQAVRLGPRTRRECSRFVHADEVSQRLPLGDSQEFRDSRRKVMCMGHEAQVAVGVDVQGRVGKQSVHQLGVGDRDQRVVISGEDERRLTD